MNDCCLLEVGDVERFQGRNRPRGPRRLLVGCLPAGPHRAPYRLIETPADDSILATLTVGCWVGWPSAGDR